jgi:hypothetical protein
VHLSFGPIFALIKSFTTDGPDICRSSREVVVMVADFNRDTKQAAIFGKTL